MNRYRICKS